MGKKLQPPTHGGIPGIERIAGAPWGELHVGSHTAFEAAGLRQIAQPSKRRLVMRIDF